MLAPAQPQNGNDKKKHGMHRGDDDIQIVKGGGGRKGKKW
jgi:hypothetical protein